WHEVYRFEPSAVTAFNELYDSKVREAGCTGEPKYESKGPPVQWTCTARNGRLTYFAGPVPTPEQVGAFETLHSHRGPVIVWVDRLSIHVVNGYIRVNVQYGFGGRVQLDSSGNFVEQWDFDCKQETARATDLMGSRGLSRTGWFALGGEEPWENTLD